MKTLLTLFALFFSSLVSAVEYPYEGDKPILPNLSADAGEDYEYMRLCGGDLYKSAENTRKRVKELSTPDYKLFQKHRVMEFSKNYSHSINCEGNKWLIEANERYLNNLKRSIDNKSNPQNSTKNKIIEDIDSALESSQEIIYVCVDSNGKHSLRNNSNSSDTSCTSYTNKDTAQKIVESANSKLGKNKYYVCVDPDTRENSLKVDPDLSIDKCTTFQNKNVAQNFLETSNAKITDEKAAEEKRIAEEKRLVEEKRLSEEKRKEEERIAEEKRIQIEKLKALIPIESELENFQNFINDVISFFEVNPDEFDVLEIASLLNSTKPILDGQISDDLKIKFDSLKNYVNQSEDFIAHKKLISKYREKLKIESLKELLGLLEKSINDLTIYLKDNITSDDVVTISEQIRSAKLVLSNPKSKKEIEDITQNLLELIKYLKNIEEKERIEEEKLIAEEKRKNEQIKNAEYKIEQLKLYLQDNITSEYTSEILEKIDLLNKNIENGTFENLLKINKEIAMFISTKNLYANDQKVVTKRDKKTFPSADVIEAYVNYFIVEALSPRYGDIELVNYIKNNLEDIVNHYKYHETLDYDIELSILEAEKIYSDKFLNMVTVCFYTYDEGENTLRSHADNPFGQDVFDQSALNVQKIKKDTQGRIFEASYLTLDQMINTFKKYGDDCLYDPSPRDKIKNDGGVYVENEKTETKKNSSDTNSNKITLDDITIKKENKVSLFDEKLDNQKIDGYFDIKFDMSPAELTNLVLKNNASIELKKIHTFDHMPTLFWLEIKDLYKYDLYIGFKRKIVEVNKHTTQNEYLYSDDLISGVFHIVESVNKNCKDEDMSIIEKKLKNKYEFLRYHKEDGTDLTNERSSLYVQFLSKNEPKIQISFEIKKDNFLKETYGSVNYWDCSIWYSHPNH